MHSKTLRDHLLGSTATVLAQAQGDNVAEIECISVGAEDSDLCECGQRETGAENGVGGSTPCQICKAVEVRIYA